VRAAKLGCTQSGVYDGVLTEPQFGTTSDRDMLSNFPSWEGCPEGGVGQIYDHRYPIDYR